MRELSVNTADFNHAKNLIKQQGLTDLRNKGLTLKGKITEDCRKQF